MFICIVYNDFYREKICGLIYFSKIKDIMSYTNNLIRYSDIKNRHRRYRTYKSLFHIIEIRNDHSCKYFSKGFYRKK